MIQGLSEPAGPGWGWDGDGDDDWDSAVLTLLALAVVAATALALHWFGSGQDLEAAGPASTGPPAQPLAGGAGPALPPESEVSGGLQGQNSGQGEPDLPGCGQGSSPTAGTQDLQPPGSGDLAAIAVPAPKTVGEVASGGALGQRHGDATPEAPQGKGREHLRPGAALLGKSQVGGASAPVLIHFTPRSLSKQVEGRVEAGGVPDKVPARQAQVRTVEQYATSWQQGVGPPGFLGRGPGGRRWQVDDSSGARTCCPPKLDPLRLGTVVSVWDAVDAAGNLSAGFQRRDPQPVPRPRKRSVCEIAESSELKLSQVAPGQVPAERPSPVGSRDILTERQKEARRLMVFLQRPGNWGAVEGPWKPSSQARELASAAALQRRLDLGSCLDVLAFAQQHGEPRLAQETYAVMSDNLLHVLGDSSLYRQLSGADRERILSLRTGRGQAVLGVTATFTVSEGTAQFQAEELQPFPLGKKGVLCPFILTLPPADPLQTAL
ncbi:Kelch domain-containing protein 7B [Pteropus alecto]|uniref:Kelch domain-containing protein 7B n=1 Tax=Pteropus alecto TaxID=9402 RepID=L5K9S0_PTEAL|nr:Kelch domain-containing protein 7B [Pteropus alecto]